MFCSSTGKKRGHSLLSRLRPLLLSWRGHFFGFALYLDRSRDARPLPRGLTGHVAHPLRSILHGRLPGAVLCAALGKPGRLLRNLKARPRLWLRYGLRTHVELLAALLVFAGEPG